MIIRLTGILHSLEGQQAEIALSQGEVVRQVMVPAYLSPKLILQVGCRVTLHTLEYLESPNQGATFVPRLIGFSSAKDREFFELFTTVKGIGNRKALRAMAVDPGQIARSINARNIRALQELPEIGKRLAETVIAELHGKVDEFLLPGEAPAAPTPSADPISEQAIAALMQLGETRADAQRQVDRARERGTHATPEELIAAVYAMRRP